MNNLPKVVTRQRGGRGSNSQKLSHQSNALATRLSSQRAGVGLYVEMTVCRRVCDWRYLQCYDVERTEVGCPLSVKRCLTRTVCRWCGRHRGNYLIITYMAVKCLYLVNVVAQLFLLDLFLGVPFHSYGIDAILGIAQVTSHHIT